MRSLGTAGAREEATRARAHVVAPQGSGLTSAALPKTYRDNFVCANAPAFSIAPGKAVVGMDCLALALVINMCCLAHLLLLEPTVGVSFVSRSCHEQPRWAQTFRKKCFSGFF